MRGKILLLVILLASIPLPAYAMHIAEGFLPPLWAGLYFILCIPFLYKGIMEIRRKANNNKDIKMLFGLVAAYCFVLSSLKLPSVTGSSSHPTGAGLGAILFGPFTMSIVGTIVLLFQAVFLGHGGITTLGANAFSMAIAGPMVSWIIYKLIKNKNIKVAVFMSAAIGDLTTYTVTSLQLASAFPAKNGGIWVSFIKFISIFAVTQLPLAIVEGILTVIIYNFIEKYSKNEISLLEEKLYEK